MSIVEPGTFPVVDGQTFRPVDYFKTFVEGTRVYNIEGGSVTPPTGSLKVVSSSDAPSAVRGTLWFKRGEGQLYIADVGNRSMDTGWSGSRDIVKWVGVAPRREFLVRVFGSVQEGDTVVMKDLPGRDGSFYTYVYDRQVPDIETGGTWYSGYSSGVAYGRIPPVTFLATECAASGSLTAVVERGFAYAKIAPPSSGWSLTNAVPMVNVSPSDLSQVYGDTRTPTAMTCTRVVGLYAEEATTSSETFLGKIFKYPTAEALWLGPTGPQYFIPVWNTAASFSYLLERAYIVYGGIKPACGVTDFTGKGPFLLCCNATDSDLFAYSPNTGYALHAMQYHDRWCAMPAVIGDLEYNNQVDRAWTIWVRYRGSWTANQQAYLWARYPPGSAAVAKMSWQYGYAAVQNYGLLFNATSRYTGATVPTNTWECWTFRYGNRYENETTTTNMGWTIFKNGSKVSTVQQFANAEQGDLVFGRAIHSDSPYTYVSWDGDLQMVFHHSRFLTYSEITHHYLNPLEAFGG